MVGLMGLGFVGMAATRRRRRGSRPQAVAQSLAV